MSKNKMLTSVPVSVALLIVVSLLSIYIFIQHRVSQVDDTHHQLGGLINNNPNVNVQNMNALQIKIDELIATQYQLVAQNKANELRFTQIESNQLNNAPENLVNAQMNNLKIDPNQEETDLANQSEQSQGYDELMNLVLSEPYDSYWDAEMDASLEEVKQRLEQFKFDSISITSKECYSTSCLVEFTLQDEIDQSIVTSLLAANGTSEVIVKTVNEGGTKKKIKRAVANDKHLH